MFRKEKKSEDDSEREKEEEISNWPSYRDDDSDSKNKKANNMSLIKSHSWKFRFLLILHIINIYLLMKKKVKLYEIIRKNNCEDGACRWR